MKLLNSNVGALQDLCSDGTIVCMPSNFSIPCKASLCKINHIQPRSPSSQYVYLKVMVLKKVNVTNVQTINGDQVSSPTQRATISSGEIIEDNFSNLTQQDLQFIKGVVSDYDKLLKRKLADSFKILD